MDFKRFKEYRRLKIKHGVADIDLCLLAEHLESLIEKKNIKILNKVYIPIILRGFKYKLSNGMIIKLYYKIDWYGINEEIVLKFLSKNIKEEISCPDINQNTFELKHKEDYENIINFLLNGGTDE